MTTAVDTNVLIDLLNPDAVQGDRAAQILDATQRDPVVICDVVAAELAANFPNSDELQRFLHNTGLTLSPSSRETLFLAGQA